MKRSLLILSAIGAMTLAGCGGATKVDYDTFKKSVDSIENVPTYVDLAIKGMYFDTAYDFKVSDVGRDNLDYLSVINDVENYTAQYFVEKNRSNASYFIASKGYEIRLDSTSDDSYVIRTYNEYGLVTSYKSYKKSSKTDLKVTYIFEK